MEQPPLVILMLSIHGLVRGHDLELGRDADTGGQVTYVVELARALGRHPDVERVDLLTRLIDDREVSPDYAAAEEKLGPRARIVRLPFGPKRYLRKEVLWKHLDHLVDRCLHYLRSQEKLPDIIHTHYADAGYVGMQLSRLLGTPPDPYRPLPRPRQIAAAAGVGAQAKLAGTSVQFRPAPCRRGGGAQPHLADRRQHPPGNCQPVWRLSEF